MGPDIGLSLGLHGLRLSSSWTSRRGTTSERWSLLVQVTHDGVVGLGEAPLPLRVADPLVVARDAASHLPRLEGAQVNAVRSRLDQSPGLPGWLRHGVFAATLDRAARAEGLALMRFLVDRLESDNGGLAVHTPPGGSLRVNGNLGPLPPGEAVKQAVALVKEGYRTIKVKSLGDVDQDLQRLRALREVLDDEVALRLDVNGAWDREEALDRLKALEPFALQYVEEPLAGGDVEDRIRLARKSPVPVAWDESVVDPASAKQLAETAAALVVKPPRLGGVDRFLEVLAAAQAQDTPVVVSTPLEGTIGRALDAHLAALVPSQWAHGLATGGLYEEDLARPRLLPERGTLRVPEGPGIGAFELVEGGLPVRRGGG